MPNDPTHPANHVFVDYENVHTIDLAIIGGKAVHFTLLLGSQQKKLDASLVEKLLQHPGSVQLVRLTSAGKNALDFTLAYYVGRAVAADPTCHVHIISRDTGFDPLLEHLRSQQIHAQRHTDFTALTGNRPVALPEKPSPKPKTQSSATDDPATRVLTQLRQHPNNRPKRKKTLVSHLLTLFGNKVTEAIVLTLVERLTQAGHLSVDEKGAVTYRL